MCRMTLPDPRCVSPLLMPQDLCKPEREEGQGRTPRAVVALVLQVGMDLGS